jgi:lipoprotein signal peptidase
MKFLITLLGLLLLIPAHAALFTITTGTRIVDGNRVPVSYQQMTSITAATTPTYNSGAAFCLIQAEAGTLRLRDDGTAPTSAVGHIITSGSVLAYTGDLTLLKIIQGGTGAIANVSCYK